MATNDPWYWRTGSEEIDPLQQQSAQLEAAKARLQQPNQQATQQPYSMDAAANNSFTVTQQSSGDKFKDTYGISQQSVDAANKRNQKAFGKAVKYHNSKAGKNELQKQIAAAEARTKAIDAARNPGMTQTPTPNQPPMTNLQRMTQDSIAHGWNGVIPQMKRPSSLLSQG
jgi:hypothetical protein